MNKITIIGGGNLGKSIISGLANSDLFEAKKFIDIVNVDDECSYTVDFRQFHEIEV